MFQRPAWDTPASGMAVRAVAAAPPGLTGGRGNHRLAGVVLLASRGGWRGEARIGERGAGEAKDHRDSKADASGHGLPPSVDRTTLARRVGVGQLTRMAASRMVGARMVDRALWADRTGRPEGRRS